MKTAPRSEEAGGHAAGIGSRSAGADSQQVARLQPAATMSETFLAAKLQRGSLASTTAPTLTYVAQEREGGGADAAEEESDLAAHSAPPTRSALRFRFQIN